MSKKIAVKTEDLSNNYWNTMSSSHSDKTVDLVLWKAKFSDVFVRDVSLSTKILKLLRYTAGQSNPRNTRQRGSAKKERLKYFINWVTNYCVVYTVEI